MNFDLPVKLDVGGRKYNIRSDYRVILEICTALNDPDLNQAEKVFAALDMFYPELDEMPADNYQEAVEKCFWFISCGDEEQKKPAPKLVDWEQDFRYIVAPINRVCGRDVRSIPYDRETNTGGFHWWSFISCYYEIGECLFAQIVRIRNAKAKGKPLDKSDKEWLRENRHLVDFKSKYSSAEEDILKKWT